MAWVSYIGTGAPGTSNSHWSGSLDMSWDGDSWLYGSGFNAIQPVNNWEVDFRPTKIRVTYSDSGTFELRIHDGSSYILEEANYVSGTELDITWAGNDLGTLNFNPGTAALDVTEIEFWEDDPTTTTTTTTTTTAPFEIIQNDKFINESLEDFWTTNLINATVNETDSGYYGASGTLEVAITAPPLAIAKVLQLHRPPGDFDIYCRLLYPGSDDQSAGFQVFKEGVTTDGWWMFATRQVNSPATFLIHFVDNVPDFKIHAHPNVEGDYEIYLRLKRVSGVVSGYYQWSKPLYDDDWISIGDPDITFEYSGAIDLALVVQSSIESIKISYDFFKNWVPAIPSSPGSQGGGANIGVVNEGFGGFGFGWG